MMLQKNLMGIQSTLEENFDLEIVEDFLEHFEMMCDVLEPLILDLPHSQNYTNDVNELFRIFHNIKSASAYLQLDSINRLAKLTEDVLEEMRQKETLLNEEVIDWLLGISDMFKLFLEDFENDRELSKIPFKLLKIPDIN